MLEFFEYLAHCDMRRIRPTCAQPTMQETMAMQLTQTNQAAQIKKTVVDAVLSPH